MDNTPADWTDAQIARWMAERDGWRVEKEGNRWLLYKPDEEDWIFGTLTESNIGEWLIDKFNTRYPHSLDAAVAWLGRRGLGWMRHMNMDCVAVLSGTKWFIYTESPTCPTARALCNAGVAAEMAREAKG